MKELSWKETSERNMKQKIKELVLINAVRYGGKANEGSVLGMILSQNPELKSKIQELKKEIKVEVKEVNKLSLKQQEGLLKKLDVKEFKKEEPHIKKGLPELKNVPKKPVFRLAPSPSGPLHIGHTIGLLLNSEYAKKYKGKFILRIEDTNPENILPEAYNMIVDEVKWLTNSNPEVQIQSDHMSLYYEKAVQLIKLGKAYVCSCSQIDFKNLVDKSKACPCRNLSIEENLKRWLKMFKGAENCVLRIKTDLNDKNPAIREWPAFRILDVEHPRKGKEFRVWPLMNFSVAVDDYESGINYVIKGKDHIVNTERQKWIYKHFNWPTPQYVHYGKIQFTDLRLKTSLIKQGIKEGKFSGWDDIKLPTVEALKKRGIRHEAFVKLVHEMGPNPVDKRLKSNDFLGLLFHFNKELIDLKTNRYFFVENPKLIEIKNAPKLDVKLPLHPAKKDKFRTFKTSNKFYVQDKLEKGKEYRLIGAFNFKDLKFTSLEHKKDDKIKLIHWLPESKELVNVEVLMDDGTLKKGLGESSIKDLKLNTIVQFQRFGFCKLDSVEKGELIPSTPAFDSGKKGEKIYRFWYMHN